MPKWISDWIGPCLIGLLTFSLLLTVAGLIASYGAEREMNAFASDSGTVSGVVSDKYIRDTSRNVANWLNVHSVARKEEHVLDVRFQTEDGKFHSVSADVSDAIYDLSRIGNPIKVTYVRSRPEWFYVADEAPPIDHGGPVFTAMFRYAGLGSLLIVILLGIFVFWPTPSGRGNRLDEISSHR